MNNNKPYIKVTWRDYPENFTKEKLKRIKVYFQKKYNALSVKIEPEGVINKNDISLKSLETFNKIADTNYQKTLMKDFIKENKIDIKWELIDRLDKKVNDVLSLEHPSSISYNNWSIKKIEFSNFLSFGDNNFINFNDLNGITVVESNPSNFAGKTSCTCDLLMFLFFGSTTKTKTNSEIFNIYRDDDEVLVKGYISIDNEDYVIERKIIRKKTKNNEYNITNVLDFMKVKSDGTFENLKGEQRKETEKFIINSIGSEEDFLSTILTTGNNLEDLIESKPTARGQLLSKFLGLDIFKTKEEIAKKMYSEWSKKLISNTNDIVSIEIENEMLSQKIVETQNEIIELNKQVDNITSETTKLEKKKDQLYLSRNNNLDEELIKINPTNIEKEISDIKIKIRSISNVISTISVDEPEDYYSEDEHNKLQNNINKILIDKQSNIKEIDKIKNTILQLEFGEYCPTCKRKLDDVDHSGEIKKLKEEQIKLESHDYENQLSSLYNEVEKLKLLKSKYEMYEKNKLIVAKHEIELEQKNIEKSNKEKLLKDYTNNKKWLEDNKKIDEQILSLKSKIQSYNNDVIIKSNVIEKNLNDNVHRQQKIETNKQLINTIKSEQDFINAFKGYFMIFGKNGVSKVIMKNMIPLLNLELQRLLNDSCFFTLELNINDKNEIDFLMIDKETRMVKNLSTGSGYEKTISSLSLRCVLTKISTLPKPNIVVMDEVFGKIANENLEMVGSFFLKIKNYFEHIILISHNELIRNWSDNILIIKKENNVSNIEYKLKE